MHSNTSEPVWKALTPSKHEQETGRIQLPEYAELYEVAIGNGIGGFNKLPSRYWYTQGSMLFITLDKYLEKVSPEVYILCR